MKKDRVKKEFQRLNKIYKVLPPNQYALLYPVIEKTAWLHVTLEDLQDAIDTEGITEVYQHGENQSGVKETVASKTFANYTKLYQNYIKQLDDKLPHDSAKDSKLKAFLNE